MSTPRLFTEAEAAAFLRKKPETLRQFRRQGRVGFHRLGRTPVYSLTDLEEFLLATYNPPVVRVKPRKAAK